MAVRLGNTDKDIDKEKDKAIMAFSLGLRISRSPALNILAKAEKGRKQEQSAEQNKEDKKRNETSHSLPAAGGQQEDNNNQETTAAAGLLAGIIVLALHGEGTEKVAGFGIRVERSGCLIK